MKFEAYIIVVFLVIELAATWQHTLLTRSVGSIGFFVVWGKKKSLVLASRV